MLNKRFKLITGALYTIRLLNLSSELESQCHGLSIMPNVTNLQFQFP